MIKNFMVMLAVAVLAVSCTRGVSRVQTLSLPKPNPTSHSFPLPLEEVRDRAREVFSIEHQSQDRVFGRSDRLDFQSTLFPECATNAVFSGTVLREPANTNDLYLHTMHSPFVLSSVYRGQAGGLPFIAAFHLHLAADGSNTLVTVTALDTEIVNGQKFGFGPCGPGYGWIYEKVRPTTVEEYSVLRYLARYLGVTNLPEVILPAS